MGIFDSVFESNNPAAGAYTKSLLADDGSVDLYIHNSHEVVFHQAWLEEGRPLELSSMDLSTWTLLSASIKQYQVGLRNYQWRVSAPILLPAFIIWFCCYLFWFLSVMVFGVAEGVTSVTFFRVSSYGLLILFFASLAAVSYFEQSHLDRVFHPAVQGVLQELAPQVAKCGWEVVLVDQPGSWCGKPSESFLRFTPLADEESAVKN